MCSTCALQAGPEAAVTHRARCTVSKTHTETLPAVIFCIHAVHSSQGTLFSDAVSSFRSKTWMSASQSQEEEEWLGWKSSRFIIGREHLNGKWPLCVQLITDGHSRPQMISYIPEGKGNWRRSLSPKAAFSIHREWNQNFAASGFRGHLLEAQTSSPVPVHHSGPWKWQEKGLKALNKERRWL